MLMFVCAIFEFEIESKRTKIDFARAEDSIMRGHNLPIVVSGSSDQYRHGRPSC